MIKQLWPGVSLDDYNQWYPLTGKIEITPEKYISIWPDEKNWFMTFALRAQNDINAYLNFILDKFPFESYQDKRIQETLVDMVFVCIEHWVYNRTPIEFNSDAGLAFNNGQTQINSFALPTINIWDLHPTRMKIWANLTQLKTIFDSAENGLVDPDLIDLDQFYSKKQTDALLDLKQNITDNSLNTTSKTVPGAINEINNKTAKFETIEDHDRDIKSLVTAVEIMLDKKQDTLIAGENITITADNVISSTTGIADSLWEINPNDPNFVRLKNAKNISASECRIGSLNEPIYDDDASNKKYVDTELNKKIDKENWQEVGKISPYGDFVEYNFLFGKKYKLHFTWNVTVDTQNDYFEQTSEFIFYSKKSMFYYKSYIDSIIINGTIDEGKIYMAGFWLSSTVENRLIIENTRPNFKAVIFKLEELQEANDKE